MNTNRYDIEHELANNLTHEIQDTRQGVAQGYCGMTKRQEWRFARPEGARQGAAQGGAA